MQKEVREILRIRFKLVVLEFAREIGSATKACREFEVPRSTFYDWKKAFDKEGKGIFAGLGDAFHRAVVIITVGHQRIGVHLIGLHLVGCRVIKDFLFEKLRM